MTEKPTIAHMPKSFYNPPLWTLALAAIGQIDILSFLWAREKELNETMAEMKRRFPDGMPGEKL